ncbi:7324_t:CDS:2 [Paraglomus occultum]|uniref:7324_t:CDS:1 n=1 Tax=Paraglomus occultum TaxID=144539 RepID=A0A9N9CKT1_9GLOM|nr:7324_t:CDS:2 [Paraglomus occultum]
MSTAPPSTYKRYIILLIVWLICQQFMIVSAIEDTDQIDDILVADSPSRVEGETTEADPIPKLSSCDEIDFICKYKLFKEKVDASRDEIQEDYSLTFKQKEERISRLDAKLKGVTALIDFTVDVLHLFDRAINVSIIAKSDLELKQETLKLLYNFKSSILNISDVDSIENILYGYYPDKKQVEEDNPEYNKHDSQDGIAMEMVDSVLQEVKYSADLLEEKMHHKGYRHAADNGKIHEVVETVIRLEELEEEETGENDDLTDENGKHENEDGSHSHGHAKVITLIDKEHNEYVLTRPNDLTMFYEDARLLNDIILIIVAAFVLGWLLNTIGLPAFLGYILAGCLLGPAGYNVIQELIQTETLSQLGVIFIVFMLGLEFSFEKIRRTWRFALGSASFIILVTLTVSLIIGFIVGSNGKEAAFVGMCISFSSTVVVERLRSQDLEQLYGPLVIQDIVFGLLLAALPALSKSGIQAILAVARLFVSLVIFGAFSFLVSRILAAIPLKRVKGTNELFLLGATSLCLLMSQVACFLGLGFEIGCFVAGVVIHTRKPNFESPVNIIEPVRDIFSCLFFASIGIHIYPSFLYNEGFLLLSLTAGVVGFKYMTAGAALVTCGWDVRRAAVMAIGMAQISEFAFVLGSRAKAAGIISREVYYLLLTTTSLSLVVTPVLWNIFGSGQESSHRTTKDGEFPLPLPFSANNSGKYE